MIAVAPRSTPSSSLTARLAIAKDLGEALLSTLDAQEQASLALKHLTRLVPCERACVLRRKDQELSLLGGLALGDAGEVVSDWFVEAENEQNGRSDSISRSTRIGPLCPNLDSAQSNGNSQKLESWLRREGTIRALVVPLVARNTRIGVIVLRRAQDHPFHPDEAAAVEEIARPLSLALENARLHQELTESFGSLRTAQKQLVRRERLAAVGTMAAVMAHEVRSPLAVFFNALASLKKLIPSDGDSPVLMEILEDECQRLDRLVSDLLDFAKPAQRQFEDIDVKHLLIDVKRAVETDPRATSTARITLGESDVGEARWDVLAVRRALVNLVLNATQAIASGRGEGEVIIGATRTDAGVCLVVQDDGPGVDPKVRERMFDPFMTTRPHGVGLGLAVVRQVVEDHGGELTVRSLEAGGTRFEISLVSDPQVDLDDPTPGGLIRG